MSDPVKENWDKYLEEIQEKLNFFRKSKEEHGDDFEQYSYEMLTDVDRFDRIMHSLEDYFMLNVIREINYPYTLKIKSGLQDILMPANKVSSIISAIQKALKTFNEKTKLNLVNVLRGSTVLCFDYDKENYYDEEFDKEKLNDDFKNFCNILTWPEQEASKELKKLFQDNEKKKNSLLSTIKKMTPVPGGEIQSIEIDTQSSIENMIEFTQELRKKISVINPSKREMPDVDWDNNRANGYVREINDVRKSFILFEDSESDDEGTKLIKIHYQEDSEKNFLLKNFKDKKVGISFSKESNKYLLESIQ